MEDRKPVGSCWVCGEHAYRRLVVPRQYVRQAGEERIPLCVRHFHKGWRSREEGLPFAEWWEYSPPAISDEQWNEFLERYDHEAAIRHRGPSMGDFAQKWGCHRNSILRRWLENGGS